MIVGPILIGIGVVWICASFSLPANPGAGAALNIIGGIFIGAGIALITGARP